MKYCPKCGKALIENSAFCMYCGDKIDVSMENASKQNTIIHGSRKKLIIGCSIVSVIVIFVAIFVALHMTNSKRLSPETNFLFSDYSGIQPVRVLGTDSFPNAKGEVIQETFPGETDWALVNAYCQDLEDYGFIREDLSGLFEDNDVDDVWYNFTKTETNEAGVRCSYTISVLKVSTLDGHIIRVQVNINSID